MLKKERELGRLSKLSPVADTEGLSQYEMVALATVMQNRFTPDEVVSTYKIKEDMNRVGFTDIAVSIALQCLIEKKMITATMEVDYNEEYYAYKMTSSGIEWLLQNQNKLVLKQDPTPDVRSTNFPDHNKDLPF